MSNDCTRAQMLMLEDLPPELQAHLDSCPECSALFARFTKMDGALTKLGDALATECPAPYDARQRLDRAIHLALPSRHALRWAVAGLAVAASITLAILMPRPPIVPPVHPDEVQFVEIPYVDPVGPNENVAIVHMDIQVATLLAVGYKVSADPDAIIPADVLVGEDGRAHAVRVLSDIELSGAGDD